VKLDDQTGIDILGNIIEASDWSLNKAFYGDLHNIGHVAISFIHDPNGGHQVQPSSELQSPKSENWHQMLHFFVLGRLRTENLLESIAHC
jgi:Hemocyanin, copper containing domain